MARTAGGGQTVVVTGIKELDRALKTLAPRVQKKVVRQAMRAGMKLVRAQARANAPVETGALRDAIKVRAGKSKRGTISIEVRVGEGDFKGKQFYAAFTEYGTSKTPAQPFMLPAFQSTGPTARDVTLAALKTGIEREAASS